MARVHSKVFQARLNTGPKEYFLGRWATKVAAQVARDRALLFFGLERALIHPRRSRALGPASPEQLRWLAAAELKQRTRTSPYFGVWWFAHGECWYAGLTANRRKYHLGTYHDAREAAVAYDRAARRLLGKKARLNFPGSTSIKPATIAELRRDARERYKASTTSRYRGVSAEADGRSAIVVLANRTKYLGRWKTER